MPSSSVASNLDSLSQLPLRRIPRQQRSRRRVADMISAAIDLLVLGGTEAVTTSAVAEKARCPNRFRLPVLSRPGNPPPCRG